MRKPDIFETRAKNGATFAEACRTLPPLRRPVGEQAASFYALLNAVGSIMTACEERMLGKEWSGKIQDGLTAAIWLVCGDGSSGALNPRICCESCGFGYERAQKSIVDLVKRHFTMEDIEAANGTIGKMAGLIADHNIRYIRLLYKRGVSIERLSDMYCISPQTTYAIVKKKTYKTVSSWGSVEAPTPNRRPTNEI